MIKFILCFIWYLICCSIGYSIGVKQFSKKGEFFKTVKKQRQFALCTIFSCAILATIISIILLKLLKAP